MVRALAFAGSYVFENNNFLVPAFLIKLITGTKPSATTPEIFNGGFWQKFL
jgi:hypothetical protein